jgi:hypothetical protein
MLRRTTLGRKEIFKPIRPQVRVAHNDAHLGPSEVSVYVRALVKW